MFLRQKIFGCLFHPKTWVWERTTEHAVPFHTIFIVVVVFWKILLGDEAWGIRMIVKWAEDKGHTHIKMVKGRGKVCGTTKSLFFWGWIRMKIQKFAHWNGKMIVSKLDSNSIFFCACKGILWMWKSSKVPITLLEPNH